MLDASVGAEMSQVHERLTMLSRVFSGLVVMQTSSNRDSGSRSGGHVTAFRGLCEHPSVQGAPLGRRVRPMKRFSAPLLFVALAAFPARAQTQGDPAGSSPLLAALNWVQGTLLGNVATSAAVIAIAVVGFLMLTGRIEWKRGLVVVVGAFIIFGAVTIVAGIRSLAGGL